jgi:hypothetical protein
LWKQTNTKILITYLITFLPLIFLIFLYDQFFMLNLIWAL